MTTKQIMTTLSRTGLKNDKEKIVSHITQGRTTSLREMTPSENKSLQNFLELKAKEQQNDLDKKRKRVIAAIFGMLKKMNRQSNVPMVLAIACRAAKVDNFNKIPSKRLDSLYNSFLKAQKDLDFAGSLVNEHIFYQENNN